MYGVLIILAAGSVVADYESGSGESDPSGLLSTLGPTAVPTVLPTHRPSTLEPTAPPTAVPTLGPTAPPTHLPSTLGPTAVPTVLLTHRPSFGPTAPPTAVPTLGPTAVPTDRPSTLEPTGPPTDRPSFGPTAAPTRHHSSFHLSRSTKTMLHKVVFGVVGAGLVVGLVLMCWWHHTDDGVKSSRAQWTKFRNPDAYDAEAFRTPVE